MSPVDFSRGAGRYDRRHGALLDAQSARRLTNAASIGPSALVLDVGAGTGRVAVVLASLGCRVVAIDVAAGMLDLLRAKASSLPVYPVRGEGARLPFQPSRFDAVIVSRVLYLMPDWQDVLLDAIRVLVPGGRLLHEWGNGEADEAWVQIREKARALFEAAGVVRPFHPGVRTESEARDFLMLQGCRETAAVSLGAGPMMALAAFLDRIVDGECSYIWNVPADVQSRCLPELRAWAAQQFDLDREAPVPREITWRVYRRRD